MAKKKLLARLELLNYGLIVTKTKEEEHSFPLKYSERDISFYSVLSPFDTEGVATYKEEVEIKDGKRDGQI